MRSQCPRRTAEAVLTSASQPGSHVNNRTSVFARPVNETYSDDDSVLTVRLELLLQPGHALSEQRLEKLHLVAANLRGFYCILD